MGKVRRCDKHCHSAKGIRCKCWCGGFFHGSGGAGNRAALAQGATELLEEHGFKKDETAYIGQEELPMKESGAEAK
ncbi:MAG: hypothetical protein PHF12_02305 [Candidatus Omnitrophica bacterium]|jgi:hypothetical protein|nr:hypothetical protein [Candidatus Omnitrophota bacterium]